MREIKSLIDQGVRGERNFALSSYTTDQNKQAPMYLLDFDATMTWNGVACIAHIPELWKGVRSVLTPGGNQAMTVISEPGFYFFLGRSDKPAAMPMQMLVAGEILPSIARSVHMVGEQ